MLLWFIFELIGYEYFIRYNVIIYCYEKYFIKCNIFLLIKFWFLVFVDVFLFFGICLKNYCIWECLVN